MSGQEKRMVTMRVFEEVNLASHILRKRYADKESKPTLTEALWRFIEESDPELAKLSKEAAKTKNKLNEIIGEDES